MSTCSHIERPSGQPCRTTERGRGEDKESNLQVFKCHQVTEGNRHLSFGALEQAAAGDDGHGDALFATGSRSF